MTITQLPPVVDNEFETWLAGEIEKQCEAMYMIGPIPVSRCEEAASWVGRPRCCPASMANYMCANCKAQCVDGDHGVCGRCQNRITSWTFVERIR